MIKHFCDRCEKELDLNNIHILCVSNGLNMAADTSNVEAERVLELCGDCIDETIKFATTKPERIGLNPEPESARPMLKMAKEYTNYSKPFQDWFDDAVKIVGVPEGLYQRLLNIITRNCLTDRPDTNGVVYLSKCSDTEIDNFKNCGKVMAPFVKKMRDQARKEIPYGCIKRLQQ